MSEHPHGFTCEDREDHIKDVERELHQAQRELGGRHEAIEFLEARPGFGPRQPYHTKSVIRALLEEVKHLDDALAGLRRLVEARREHCQRVHGCGEEVT